MHGVTRHSPLTTIARNKTGIPEYTVEDLKPVPNTRNVALVWAEPGADLSQHDRIRKYIQELFMEVSTEELQKDGYILTNERAEDVLMAKAAIIDLEVNAPDVRSAGRTNTFTTSPVDNRACQNR